MYVSLPMLYQPFLIPVTLGDIYSPVGITSSKTIGGNHCHVWILLACHVIQTGGVENRRDENSQAAMKTR
jgi:hypothetical protein